VAAVIGEVVVMASDDPAALTVIESAIVAVFVGVVASVTVTVKDDVPAVVGVPEITPVAATSASPPGRAPTVTDQL
jgi:hypothetical protein